MISRRTFSFLGIFFCGLSSVMFKSLLNYLHLHCLLFGFDDFKGYHLMCSFCCLFLLQKKKSITEVVAEKTWVLIIFYIFYFNHKPMVMRWGVTNEWTAQKIKKDKLWTIKWKLFIWCWSCYIFWMMFQQNMIVGKNSHTMIVFKYL